MKRFSFAAIYAVLIADYGAVILLRVGQICFVICCSHAYLERHKERSLLV